MRPEEHFIHVEFKTLRRATAKRRHPLNVYVDLTQVFVLLFVIGWLFWRAHS